MRLIKLLVVVVFVSLLQASDTITLNFKDLKIQDFIKMVAKITNKNILLSTNISGKVNFIAVKPVKKEELFNILVNILKSKGWALVETPEGFLKLVRSKDAIKEIGFKKQPIGKMTTQIISLQYIEAPKALKEINPFLSKYATTNILDSKNMLIITDYESNVNIAKQLLKKLDQQNQMNTKFIKLKNNSAKNVYAKLKNIASSLFNQKLIKYKILIDENTNSIIIIAPSDMITLLEKYITKFDVKPSVVSQSTKVIHISNSDAESLSKIISDIINKKYTKDKPSVTFDKETNNLIIIGNKKQREVILSIIKALDIPKQQVYIKVKILEISNSKMANIGARLGLLGGSASGSGLYTMSMNLGGPAVAIDTGSLGISTPSITQGVALGATINLLETTGAAKKLSAPSILCVNNTESNIYVGRTESVITQSTVGATTTDLTKNTYSRQDIGLTLNIKPRIDSDKKVALDVKYLVEDVLPGSQVGLPTTSKRELKTSTIVQNGQSIVIGGLIRNNKSFTINKVPFLGDIPVIGALFRDKNTNINKTTLVIILTPYIIKDSTQFEKLKKVLAKLTILQSSLVKKIKKEKLKEE